MSDWYQQIKLGWFWSDQVSFGMPFPSARTIEQMNVSRRASRRINQQSMSGNQIQSFAGAVSVVDGGGVKTAPAATSTVWKSRMHQNYLLVTSVPIVRVLLFQVANQVVQALLTQKVGVFFSHT